MKGEAAFPTPAVLGHEISGMVAELGEGVEGLEVGDNVVGTFIMPCGTCATCRVGREDLCEKFFSMNRLKGTLYDGETRLFRANGHPLAMYSMGGLAEYSVVPVAGLFPLPASIPLEEAGARLRRADSVRCGPPRRRPALRRTRRGGRDRRRRLAHRAVRARPRRPPGYRRRRHGGKAPGRAGRSARPTPSMRLLETRSPPFSS